MPPLDRIRSAGGAGPTRRRRVAQHAAATRCPRSPQPASNTRSLIRRGSRSSGDGALLAFAHESVAQPFHHRPDRRRQDLDRPPPCHPLWPALRRSRPARSSALRRAGQHRVRDRGRSRLPPARKPVAGRMQPPARHPAGHRRRRRAGRRQPPAPDRTRLRGLAGRQLEQQLERLARDTSRPLLAGPDRAAAAAARCARSARRSTARSPTWPSPAKRRRGQRRRSAARP